MPQFIGLKGVSENKISVTLFILIYSSGLQSFWVKYLHMCSLVKPRKYNYGEHNKVEDNALLKLFLKAFFLHLRKKTCLKSGLLFNSQSFMICLQVL